jgi:hypothetical protein
MKTFSAGMLFGSVHLFLVIRKQQTQQDPYLLMFVDMNVDVNPKVPYIYLWDGTHQEYKYVINKFNLPSAI